MLVLHFPLLPENTVVKPASSVNARLRGPGRAASQCFLPNSMIGLFDSNFLHIILIVNSLILCVDQNPVELDPLGLITCGGVEFRRSTILPWIFAAD